MGKLKLQMNITIDGFVGDSNGKLDWMLPETDQKQVDFLNDLLKNVDLILLGRKMALESIPYWEKISKSGKQDQEADYARFFMETPKIIFSKTLEKIGAQNTSIEDGDAGSVIKKLKEKSGKEIMVYGGAAFASSLLDQNLVDELNLFVHPVSLGKGLAIFNKVSKFKLVKSEAYENGIVLNVFKP